MKLFIGVVEGRDQDGYAQLWGTIATILMS